VLGVRWRKPALMSAHVWLCCLDVLVYMFLYAGRIFLTDGNNVVSCVRNGRNWVGFKGLKGRPNELSTELVVLAAF